MPLYIPLMFPVMAADWMFSLNSVQYSFAQRQAVCWALLLAILRICRFLSLEVRLYSARAAHLASMMGVITVDLALNQSCDFDDLFPKVAKAVRYKVSRRTSHFSVAESPGCKDPNSFSKVWANCSMRSGWDILLTLIRGIPFVFVWWISLVASWSYSTPRIHLYHSPHCGKSMCGEHSW